MKTGVTESGQNLTEWVGNQGNRISKNKKGEWLGTYCEGDSDPSDRLSKSASVLLAAKPGELASLQRLRSGHFAMGSIWCWDPVGWQTKPVSHLPKVRSFSAG